MTLTVGLLILTTLVAAVVYSAVILAASCDDATPGLREHEAQLQMEAVRQHRRRSA